MASNRLVWRKNPLPPGTPSMFKQRLAVLDMAPDALGNHIQRHQVVPPGQHHDVGVLARGLDKLLVHGLDGVEVLGDHRVQRTAPLLHVPKDAAQYAHVGVGVHEDLHVHQLPQGRIGENEDALHDNHLGGAHLHRFLRAVVDGVVVHRAADGLPRRQLPKVVHHQAGVEGVRVVVVQRRPLLIGHPHVLFIVVVVVDHGYVRPESVLKPAGQGGLARAGAPGNADDHGVHTLILPVCMRRRGNLPLL